ncbi:MAG: hypothetical protein JO247_07305 [Chloroflexi bacterium]|nr:hypothetical protein [Chloroflexota bacterium]
MSTLALELRAQPARRVRARGMGLSIARHVDRRARLWAVIWSAVFGLEVLAQARGYAALYPTAASRAKLASGLQPYAILVGPARHTDTVAGFTVWKVLVFCAVIAAIWGVRTAVGLLRGQEDAGQWELLIAGPITRRWATAQALLGLGVTFLEMFAITLLLTLLTASMPGVHFSTLGSVLFALTLVSAGALFLAVGALASQLRASSGEASTLGMLVLGASYLVSMVANAQTSWGRLRWLTPVGWIEEVNPFRDTQPQALVLIGLSTAACVAATLVLAGRRDLMAGVLRERNGVQRGSRWLAGPTGLALRLNLGAGLAWVLGLALFGTMFGVITRSAVSLFSSSPELEKFVQRLGAHRMAEAYLGTMFLMFGVTIAVLAASQIAAMRDEEASGRLDNLLVEPVRRVGWLGGRLLVALGVVAVAGVGTAVCTWLGAASQHAGIDLLKCLEAGVNSLAPAIFILGAGLLVLGIAPRLAPFSGYAIVGYSFLMSILGSFVKGEDWIKDSSLFAHIALAPAATPDWGNDSIIVAIGAAAAIIGAIAFQRRDVQYA